MSQEEPIEGIRFTDRRGQNKAAPTEDDKLTFDQQRLRAELAEQARAAKDEDAAQEAQQQPGFECAAFVLLTLDRQGNMRLWSRVSEIQAMQEAGISMDREATPNDLINMTAQLNLINTGNEISSRVIQALAQQAAMAAQQRGMAPMGNGLGVDPRVQRAAQKGG